MIKIEKGVPLPPRSNGFGKAWTHIARQMEVGDSVLLSNKDEKQRFRGTVQRTSSNRYSERKQPDGTYRVWRVK